MNDITDSGTPEQFTDRDDGFTGLGFYSTSPKKDNVSALSGIRDVLGVRAEGYSSELVQSSSILLVKVKGRYWRD